MKLLSIPFIAATALIILGCSGSPLGPYGYTDQYREQLSRTTTAVAPPPEVVDAYLALFNPLDHQVLAEQAPELLAEALYFNDTLMSAYSRDQLISHLSDTARRLDDMAIEVTNIIYQGDDVWVVWIMDATFSVLGRQRHSQTLGISQLRFNAQQQLIFHQDFWDSSQGLDQHLPIIGPLTRWLRDY